MLISLDSQRGLFGIFVIVIILTIYEVIFFFNIAVPQVEFDLNVGLDEVANALADLITDEVNKETNDQTSINLLNTIIKKKFNTAKNDIFDDHIENMLLTSANREKKKIDKLNIYTKITAGILITVLVILMIIIGINISHNAQGMGAQLGSATLTAFITVVLLIGFQVLFYYFSMNSWYSTDNELLNVIIDSIKVGEIKNNNGSN